jgi:hypothetical protein
MTTDEVLEQLRHPGNEIPRAAIAGVIARPEEFVPRLIAEIERVTQQGNDADRNDCLPSLALYLLAQLRETRALEPILACFALKEDVRSKIFGDVLAQNGAQILAAVGRNRPERLREFVIHPGIHFWIRAVMLDALVALVYWGELSRDFVAGFIAELFRTHAFGKDIESWSVLVGTCLDFHPAEFIEPIRRLYELELVDCVLVGDFDAVEEAAEEEPEVPRRQFLERHSPITDTAEAIAWWDWSGPEDPFANLSEDDLPPLEDEAYLPDVPGATYRREAPKIGRNDLCPCGSGKKYKKCCGKNA